MKKNNLPLLNIYNGQSFDFNSVPLFDMSDFQKIILQSVVNNGRVVALFVRKMENINRLICILANDQKSKLEILASNVEEKYPSLTPQCPQVHLFEREIYEKYAILPEGHPWLKPVRFNQNSTQDIGITDFFSMQQEEIHEVAVGPIHAGVIEPGHFRFLCSGERVHHLEISLGYQHRGIENAILDEDEKRIKHYMQTLSGDTTIGHTTAYYIVRESLSGIQPSARSEVIRAIALELERIANHTGDLGALAGDTGFLPTMSYCGRIRGDVLNLTALICGNRFGRNLLTLGGVLWDIEEERAQKLLNSLNLIEKHLISAIELMFDTPSVLARMENTGKIDEDVAKQIGLVGPAARASGIEYDVRAQHPFGAYKFFSHKTFTLETGDCFARGYIRWLEIKQSIKFIRQQLQFLPKGEIFSLKENKITPNRMVVSLVEAWRGEACHIACSNENGKLAFYKIIDPSFHNWFGLALALREQEISDFPLCNKSFNLSYCGFDL